MIDALIAFALLASAITANKIVLCAIPATYFVALRMLSAGFLLLIYYYSATEQRIVTKDLSKLCVIAAATTFIPSLLKAYALRELISSKAALLGALDPFVTALYAFVLWGEHLNKRQWFGIMLGFLSICSMSVIHACQTTAHAWLFFSYGELAALAAVFVSRAGWIGAQGLLKAERYTPPFLNGVLMILGGCYALISAFFAGEIVAVVWSWPVFLALSYTIIVGNIIAYSLYGYLLKRHSVTYVALASLLIPLFVHLYGPIIIGEPLSLTFFVAFTFMLGGLYIFTRTS